MIGLSHLNLVREPYKCPLRVRVRISMTLDSCLRPPKKEKKKKKESRFPPFQSLQFGVSKSWFGSLDKKFWVNKTSIQARSSPWGINLGTSKHKYKYYIFRSIVNNDSLPFYYATIDLEMYRDRCMHHTRSNDRKWINLGFPTFF